MPNLISLYCRPKDAHVETLNSVIYLARRVTDTAHWMKFLFSARLVSAAPLASRGASAQDDAAGT